MIFRRIARRRWRSAAAVEMALLTLPLAFMGVATVDYSRAFYASATISNCARNGAFYLSNPTYAATSPYTSVQQAALADAGQPPLTPTPTVTNSSGTDSMGNAYISVTVSYQFTTIMSYPGIPTTTNLSRKVQMRVVSD